MNKKKMLMGLKKALLSDSIIIYVSVLSTIRETNQVLPNWIGPDFVGTCVTL